MPLNKETKPNQVVAWKICMERWMIGADGRESGKSVLAAQSEGDDFVLCDLLFRNNYSF